MKFLSFLAFSVLTYQASATTLVYDADLSQTPDLDPTTFEVCMMPMTFQIDSRDDLAITFTQKALKSGAKSVQIKTIESSVGSIGGGDLKEPYLGDYRTRVEIIRTEEDARAYPEGVYKRVEIVTYGSTSAPKAFQVHTQLLNYLDSAELAEEMACPAVSYKLR